MKRDTRHPILQSEHGICFGKQTAEARDHAPFSFETDSQTRIASRDKLNLCTAEAN